MDKEEMMFREVVKAAKAFSEPIDLEPLIKEGILIKKGKSYYVKNIHLLPEGISKRVKEATPTRNGVRVTFYKEKKSLKKIADKFSHYLK